MGHILVLYYSRDGATRTMAKYIALGIEMIAGCEARCRTVPEAAQDKSVKQTSVDVYVEKSDLATCSGLALGSATRFGNMAAELKGFIDSTGDLWLSAALADKPACVFTAAGSSYAGQGTLISMMLPLLHHRMLMVGPVGDAKLSTGCAELFCPYGLLHVSGQLGELAIPEHLRELCILQGKRLASLSHSLHT